MAFGDTWHLPSGHIGIELSRSGGWLKIARLVPGWPWPAPPQDYIEVLCTPSVEPVSNEMIAKLREVPCGS